MDTSAQNASKIDSNLPNYLDIVEEASNASEKIKRNWHDGLPEAEGRVSPLKAIRKFCLDCVGNSSLEVKRCTGFDCALWEFRFGRRPHTAKEKFPELFDHDHVRRLHAK